MLQAQLNFIFTVLFTDAYESRTDGLTKICAFAHACRTQGFPAITSCRKLLTEPCITDAMTSARLYINSSVSKECCMGGCSAHVLCITLCSSQLQDIQPAGRRDGEGGSYRNKEPINSFTANTPPPFEMPPAVNYTHRSDRYHSRHLLYSPWT